jgi:hypothetical protein
MDNEAEQLLALLDACYRVLPHVEGRDDDSAEAIRDTCRAIEARLRELGVSFESPFAEKLSGPS